MLLMRFVGNCFGWQMVCYLQMWNLERCKLLELAASLLCFNKKILYLRLAGKVLVIQRYTCLLKCSEALMGDWIRCLVFFMLNRERMSWQRDFRWLSGTFLLPSSVFIVRIKKTAYRQCTCVCVHSSPPLNLVFSDSLSKRWMNFCNT